MSSKEKYPKVLMIIVSIVNIVGVAYMSLATLALGMLHRTTIDTVSFLNVLVLIVVLIIYFIFLKKYSTKFKNGEITRAKLISFLIASPFLIGFLSMGLCIGIDYTYTEISKKV